MDNPDVVSLVKENLKHKHERYLRVAIPLVNRLTNNGENQLAVKLLTKAGSRFKKMVSALLRNRRSQFGTRIEGRDYLNIGCGRNIHENFVNLDYHWQPGIDLCWDVTKGLPLKDASLKGIFIEHCLEHLAFDAIDLVFSEFWRVLKPEGVLRIVVPDGELYLTRYTEIVRRQSFDELPYASGDRQGVLYSPIMSVNRLFYECDHRFIYDFHVLQLLLTNKGFAQINKASFRQGLDPQLLIDAESRIAESLYVEASKPRYQLT